MRKQKMLRPQDIVLAVKLAVAKEKGMQPMELARELVISQAEVYNSLERLRESKLIDSENRPILRSLRNLIVHGLPFIYPAELGPVERGILVAHSGPILNKEFKPSGMDKVVWSDPEGKDSGQSIKPLFKSIPQASKRDKKLYEVLSLIEALRVGRVRERKSAERHLQEALA
ncbi:MAG: hypothetical protein CL677_00380 [Bdellovibrionaceae bacterium]|jgi:hypothetical protein|nr:hypothetical protein [Pseudobdellovibrionaceae bacterium]|tara:strand:+ start:49 stop:564 length:516 start_codon:yes stop_codon:yes gene_type:complete